MKGNRGTEIKIDNYKDFNVVFGTMDKKNPKSIYIKISAWGTPKNGSDLPYSKEVQRLSKGVKRNLFSSLNKNRFEVNRTLVDLDMRVSGIGYGKHSFMSCEITLFQTNNYLLNSDNMLFELNKISDEILKKTFVNNEDFEFNKKKIKIKTKSKEPNHKD